MGSNFGDTKNEILSKLDNVYKSINSLLNSGNPSLISLKKQLDDFLIDEESSPNIYKNESSFINVISSVTDSLKNINSLVLSTKTFGSSGCPVTTEIKKAEYSTLDYIDLITVKLWHKFRDSDDIAYLIDVDGNRYTKNSDALFYIKQCSSYDELEPLYRENFNIEPYRDDNKTLYLYVNKGIDVKNTDDGSVTNYSIKNLRTIVTKKIIENDVEKNVDEEKQGMIFVYKNEKNIMTARLLFDVFFPIDDDEKIGYPGDYFCITEELNYNLETDEYSLRVIDDI